MSFLNYLFDNLVEAIKDLKGFKFYFVVVLVFIFSVTYTVKDSLTLYIKTHTNIEFRECRDQQGLQTAMTKFEASNPLCKGYTVYLFQPKNNSIYKKLVVSDDSVILHTPLMQGVYLKDEPTINIRLNEDSYYLLTHDEAIKHIDTQVLADLNLTPVLFYALKVNNVIVGEINLNLDHMPTPAELDKMLKDLSPMLYSYVI